MNKIMYNLFSNKARMEYIKNQEEVVTQVKQSFEKLVITLKQKEQNNTFLSKFVSDTNCYLYVSRISDHKIVWISEYVRKTFGDVIGQICYEVFQNLLNPCDFCDVKSKIQEEGKEYTRIFHNKSLHKVFFIIDVVYVIEGEKYRFEKAIDITNQMPILKQISKSFVNGN